MRTLRAWLVRVRSLSDRPARTRASKPSSRAICSFTSTTTFARGWTPARRAGTPSSRSEASSAFAKSTATAAGFPPIDSLLRDLRYGVRTLIKNPGFTLAGIVILGLGIGVNSAIFTVVNAVVLKPLPFAKRIGS